MVQLRYPGGLLALHAGAEQVGEQVMVTPPAAGLVQRHQEQSGPLHLLQRFRATRPGRDAGICSLVASNTSPSGAATPDDVAAGGSAIANLHALCVSGDPPYRCWKDPSLRAASFHSL